MHRVSAKAALRAAREKETAEGGIESVYASTPVAVARYKGRALALNININDLIRTGHYAGATAHHLHSGFSPRARR